MPLRPAWTCAVCCDFWPCETRRKQLLAEYQGTPASLGLLMGGYYDEAMRDLPHWPPVDIHRRFLGWIRSGRNG
jgi:hypothetical protein